MSGAGAVQGGLFGKLPCKRDFVALFAPRAFLAIWEPWLQGGMSASRMRLAGEWQTAFLRAPIWRFWLGSDLCGTTIAGALMPSVDAVGRYFPLTVVAVGEEAGAFPPPEIDPQDGWYGRLEEFLLFALTSEATFDAVSRALGRLEAPSRDGVAPVPQDTTRLADGTLLTPVSASDFQSRLAALRLTDYARAYATSTFWWTVGGEGYRPLALVGKRMPDPHLFSGMLTGHFDAMIS